MKKVEGIWKVGPFVTCEGRCEDRWQRQDCRAMVSRAQHIFERFVSLLLSLLRVRSF